MVGKELLCQQQFYINIAQYLALDRTSSLTSATLQSLSVCHHKGSFSSSPRLASYLISDRQETHGGNDVAGAFDLISHNPVCASFSMSAFPRALSVLQVVGAHAGKWSRHNMVTSQKLQLGFAVAAAGEGLFLLFLSELSSFKSLAKLPAWGSNVLGDQCPSVACGDHEG